MCIRDRHMVYHCLFRHMVKQISFGETEREAVFFLWDLSCDIAIERLIDGNYHRSVRYSKSLLRRDTYGRLEREADGLSLIHIYTRSHEQFVDRKLFH